ncbi:MAG TPA: hypothetical protein VHT05_01420 [Candidatus Elarobacter sp.]|jgi:hypothetical protein|nr:hypothetical protein [Candidatus Elarobacter sp.]
MRSALVFIAALAVALTAATPAGAQPLPNWNVKLPAHPGSATQTVALAGGVLTLRRTFPQNTMTVSVPLTRISAVSQPYEYQSNWLIDLRLGKNVTLVNKLTTGLVDRTPVPTVSLMFPNANDAAGARTYLLQRLHLPNR